MQFFTVILALFLTLFAAADGLAQSCPLGLVYPAKSALGQPVQFQVQLENGLLKAHFEVRSATVFGKALLAPGEYPYMFDVVELFVSVGPGGLPYYEFELTPNAQTLQVKIIDLHHPFMNGIDMGMQSQVQSVDGGWSADIEIPLKNLNWDGNSTDITGNAYAILGQSPNRTYFSAFMPPLPKVNFHQPQYFQSLLKCAVSPRTP